MSPVRRVTVVAHEVGPIGGMERQLTELILGLIRQGTEVTVVARRCDLPPGVKVRWIRVLAPRKPFVLAFPAFFLIATVLAARHRGDVLHLTGAITANSAEVVTVHCCHTELRARSDRIQPSRGTMVRRLNAWIAEAMNVRAERLVYIGRAQRLVAVSEGLALEVRRHFPLRTSPAEVVSNGVDLQRFIAKIGTGARERAAWGLPDDLLIALFVGGNWDGKGLMSAVEALERSPRWALVIVGSGDEAVVRERARQLGVGPRLRFLGRRADAERCYAAADVFVLPSRYETFSLVTFEAAASGLPILVGRVSGATEIVEDGHSGIFITPTAASVADGFGRLEDAEVRAAMGTAARRAAERYPWSAMVEGYCRIYEKVATP